MTKKQPKSIAWQFFEKVEQNGKCNKVLCNLCCKEYKFIGNTTNMRSHLAKKHPIQWGLINNEPINESMLSLKGTKSRKRKYSTNSVQDLNENTNATINLIRQMHDVNKEDWIQETEVIEEDYEPENNIKRINVIDNSLLEENTNETVTLVRQVNDEGEEEWLEETDPIEDNYEPPPSQIKVKLKTVKREVITPPRRISMYNLPSHAYKQPEVTKKEDEWSIFGEYIANKMRKFSNHRTRSNIQQLISTLMWQAEQGQYHNQENVKKLLLYIFQVEPVAEAQINQSNETNS